MMAKGWHTAAMTPAMPRFSQDRTPTPTTPPPRPPHTPPPRPTYSRAALHPQPHGQPALPGWQALRRQSPGATVARVIRSCPSWLLSRMSLHPTNSWDLRCVVGTSLPFQFHSFDTGCRWGQVWLVPGDPAWMERLCSKSPAFSQKTQVQGPTYLTFRFSHKECE